MVPTTLSDASRAVQVIPCFNATCLLRVSHSALSAAAPASRQLGRAREPVNPTRYDPVNPSLDLHVAPKEPHDNALLPTAQHSYSLGETEHPEAHFEPVLLFNVDWTLSFLIRREHCVS